MCDAVSITLNKNCVPGDRSAVTPGGVRVGACAMTTRKMVEEDFEQIGQFLHEALQIALKVQEESGPKLVDFVKCLKGNADIAALRKSVKRLPLGSQCLDLTPRTWNTSLKPKWKWVASYSWKRRKELVSYYWAWFITKKYFTCAWIIYAYLMERVWFKPPSESITVSTWASPQTANQHSEESPELPLASHTPTYSVQITCASLPPSFQQYPDPIL